GRVGSSYLRAYQTARTLFRRPLRKGSGSIEGSVASFDRGDVPLWGASERGVEEQGPERLYGEPIGAGPYAVGRARGWGLSHVGAAAGGEEERARSRRGSVHAYPRGD